MMTEAVEDLTTTLNEAASAAGVVGGMVDSITQAINQVRVLGCLWTEPGDQGPCAQWQRLTVFPLPPFSSSS